MPHTSARLQERDRLRKRAVSFALLCAAGHILLSSDERAVCLHTGRESPLRRSYARRGISCCRPMSAPPALCTGRKLPLRRSYARRGISCCRPVCAPFALRTGRKSPLRRRFTSERMTRRGCRPLPVLRLPGGIKAASAAVHANSPQEGFCNDKQSLSLNHAVQSAPFTQGSLQCGKSPRGGHIP